MKIGFIGQGWIGKNYADDFEARGYSVVRYSLEEPHVNNKALIKDCEVVFIAVPTPTTKETVDIHHVEDALTNVAKGATAVIKSTVPLGTTKRLQETFPDVYVMHSPEFLVEKTAAYDAANPNRNILGIPIDDEAYRSKAEKVLSVLPKAPYEQIMNAHDAELVKYAGNCFLYTKVIYMNLLYDLVSVAKGDWSAVREALVHDPRIGNSHTEPVHQSGRGAGGHCFIKDFEAFRRMYDTYVADEEGKRVLDAQVQKNNKLLLESQKDIELLEGVYGTLKQ